MSETQKIVVADRYELESVVGRGGYGVVYRALDRQGGKTVAVKVLSPGSARDPSVVERMVREQQAMVALAGTRAVSAVDLCHMPSGALCLVMEWLEGEDLEQTLSRLETSGRRMEPARVLEIIGTIADTLGKAHEIGIIHRDIKPANVFLMSNEAGGVRLLDFGLSRMKSAATLTAVGTVMGSPSYIAPESWGGNSKLVDQRVDVYSLGVIAFRALGGEIPFAADSLVEKLTLVTTAPRPSLRALRPELPAQIDGWVAQALAIDPEQRFRSARALHNALSEALGFGIPGQAFAPESSVAAEARERLESAFKSAVHAAKDLFKRFTPRSEPAARPEQPKPVVRGPLPPIPVPPAARQARDFAPIEAGGSSLLSDDKKSFIAEWLSGSELELSAPAGDSDEDMVKWLSGDTNSKTDATARTESPAQKLEIPELPAKRLGTVRPTISRKPRELPENLAVGVPSKTPAPRASTLEPPATTAVDAAPKPKASKGRKRTRHG